MKLVRESLNEIKQHIEGSGLGSIGVGRSGMYRIYKKLITIQPDIEKIQPMTISRPNWLFNEEHPMHLFKDKLPEIMHTPLSNIIRLSWQSLSFTSDKYLEPLFYPTNPNVKTFSINVEYTDDLSTYINPVDIYVNESQGGAFMKYEDGMLNALYRYYLIIKPNL